MRVCVFHLHRSFVPSFVRSFPPFIFLPLPRVRLCCYSVKEEEEEVGGLVGGILRRRKKKGLTLRSRPACLPHDVKVFPLWRCIACECVSECVAAAAAVVYERRVWEFTHSLDMRRRNGEKPSKEQKKKEKGKKENFVEVFSFPSFPSCRCVSLRVVYYSSSS